MIRGGRHAGSGNGEEDVRDAVGDGTRRGLFGCGGKVETETGGGTDATAQGSEAVPVTGGWAVAPKVTDYTVAIPEEAASAFAAGCEGYVGMDLSPLALLATQAVAGTNYRILCVGAPTVPDAESELCVVDVYEGLEGKAEFSDIRTFDLLAYV